MALFRPLSTIKREIFRILLRPICLLFTSCEKTNRRTFLNEQIQSTDYSWNPQVTDAPTIFHETFFLLHPVDGFWPPFFIRTLLLLLSHSLKSMVLMSPIFTRNQNFNGITLEKVLMNRCRFGCFFLLRCIWRV